MSTISSTDPHPKPSALTTLLDSTTVAPTPQNALAIQTLHNLQYQHTWTGLQLHVTHRSATSSPNDTPTRRPASPVNEPLDVTSDVNALIPLPVPMVSGRPPTPLYTHPDVQAYMIKNAIKEADIPVETEWVLPIALGEKWTLRRFAEVFDSLPDREPLMWMNLEENREPHRDAKRVLLAMLSHAGSGGDGTFVYYVMQEGDVKPRQN